MVRNAVNETFPCAPEGPALARRSDAVKGRPTLATADDRSEAVRNPSRSASSRLKASWNCLICEGEKSV
jgi:hypothetical protein